MVIQERTYTLDEFLEIARQPENEDKLFELIRGVIVEVNPPSALHVIISGRLFGFVFAFVEQNDLGYVTGETGGYALGGADYRMPDVAFIAKDRLPALNDLKVFPVAPDLAVEVVSPSNKPRDLLDKIEDFFAAGTRLMWVVYPLEQVIDVYHPAENGGLHIQKFTINDTLDGEDILPGFKLGVRDVFPK
jgi:Uma2 family endonuclease